MNSRRKNTFIDIAFSYGNQLIAFINGIVIIPFYLYHIDKITYGAWLATGNILFWISIVDPGTGTVAKQRISRSAAQGNREIIAYQVYSSILISFIISIGGLLIGYLLSSYLGEIIGIQDKVVNQDLKEAFRISIFAVSIALFGYSINAILIGLQKQFYTGSSRIVGRIIGIIVTVLMVLNGYGIKGLATGVLVTNSIELLLNLYFLKNTKIPFAFSKRYFKSYARIFSITFLSKLFGSIYNNIDLVLVSRILNPEIVVNLELTRRPMRLIKGFLMSPSKSIMPTLSNFLGRNKPVQARELITKLLLSFFCLFLTASFGFSMFNEDVISLWIGSEYFIGRFENTLLSFGLMVLMSNYLLSSICVALGNLKGTSYANMINSIIGLALIVSLGYWQGVVGIILAPAISILVCQAWYYLRFIDRKIKLAKTFWFKLIKIAFIGACIYGLLHFINKGLIESFGYSYWLMLLQAFILVIILLTTYIIIIKEFRAFVLYDILKVLNLSN